MIRPFHLRDLALIHRLGDRGVLLNREAAVTASQHPLRHALRNMLVGGHYCTFVYRRDQGQDEAFVQFFWDAGHVNAYLALLATSCGVDGDADGGRDTPLDESVWHSLLDELAAVVGRRGGHNIVAEAPENGPALPILRQAGFAVYTRQDLWTYDRLPISEPNLNLRPRRPADDWDAQVLYANIVPRLIQTFEPNPPLDTGDNWVLYEGQELAALIHIVNGPAAGWMRLLLHPNAETEPVDIIRGALWAAGASSAHPLYCCVSRYQSWLQGPLEEVGFQHGGSQAVMVRHIAKRVESPQFSTSGVLEPQTVPGSAPLVQGFSRGTTNGHQHTRRAKKIIYE